MDVGSIIGVSVAFLSLIISVWAIFESKQAVHTANELRERSRGDVLVSVNRAKVSYTTKNVWLTKANCPPEHLDNYEVSFNLIANSRLNVPTNIHDLELISTFTNGETKNITEYLEARTHANTVIENPLTINVPENGAYSANYSVIISKEVLWGDLEFEKTPGIKALRLKYVNDRDESKEIDIKFEEAVPLTEEDLCDYLNFDFHI